MTPGANARSNARTDLAGNARANARNGTPTAKPQVTNARTPARKCTRPVHRKCTFSPPSLEGGNGQRAGEGSKEETSQMAMWPHFPHCPSCHRRLWSKSPRHLQDPRGPILPPTATGACPHCGHHLRGDAQ